MKATTHMVSPLRANGMRPLALTLCTLSLSLTRVACEQQQLYVPQRCRWALEQLYVPQRCNNAAHMPCDATRRDLSNETLTREMEDQALKLERLIHKFVPPPSADAPATKLQVVDIGAGLGMYHVLLHHKLRASRVETVHTILDRSENGVSNGSKNQGHAGYHKDGEFPFYSSLECASDIAIASGMDAQHYKTVDASPSALLDLGSGFADVLMSIVSWLFHYPEPRYAEAAAKVVKPVTGRLIITPKYLEDAKHKLMSAGFTMCQMLIRPHGHLVCCVGCASIFLNTTHPG